MARFALVTFGCQMNEHDSLRMSESLVAAGHEPVPDASDADWVVLNTCSIREKAEQKLRSEVGRLGLLKRRRPGLVIAVAGCVAEQEGERLLRALPQVDLVIGPDRIAELADELGQVEDGAPPRVRTGFDLDAPRFLRAAAAPGRVAPVAQVTIMKGCDERCSYCIVPSTRGPERYRPAAEILEEIERLVAAGAREVQLLGQTVDSYRDPDGSLPPAPGAGQWPWRHSRHARPRDDESEFPALLRAIAARCPELVRLRYASPHPRHLTVSLIRAHADLAVLARHVHMPVQSGSDRVLRRMVRRYGADEYRERVAALRAEVPGLTLSTDVIVGFPGETEDDFAETLALVSDVGFTGLFGFKYSPRPGTPSLALGDDVPEEVKADRLARLFALAERQRSAHLEGLVGATALVLFEGQVSDGNWSGRTERNEIVHAGAKGDLTGALRPVRVVRAFRNSLQGELVDERERAPFREHRAFDGGGELGAASAVELSATALSGVPDGVAWPVPASDSGERRSLPVVR